MLFQEKFFYKLNQSIDHGLKKAHWEAYRGQVTTYILSVLKQQDHLLIIGAGGCDDFNLEAIISNVKKVTLSDIDLSSMKQSILKLGLKRDQVELLQKDYTGLSDYLFFETLDLMVKEGQSVKAICQYIEVTFQKLQEKDLDFMNQVVDEVDVIVVLPIYSQLVLPIFQVIMGQIRAVSFYSEKDLMAIQNIFLEYSTNAIHVMNSYLSACAGNGTKVMLFADILEYQEGDLVYNQLEGLSIEALIQLEKNYIETYGYGFGHYGIKHLDHTVALKVVDYLIWPYAKDRKLIVKVMVN